MDEKLSRLHYHHSTFELLGLEPKWSEENRMLIDAIEKDLGIRFPDSLREWYSLETSVQILHENSNMDRPIPLEKLGLPLEMRLPYNPVKEGILPVMIENQGVCTWAIELDGMDDPAVLVEVNSAGNKYPPSPHWQFCAESFSQWIHCFVIDNKIFNQTVFVAHAEPLSDKDLAFLKTHFQEGITTFWWPCEYNYSFHGEYGDLKISSCTSRQADWWIAPRKGQEGRLLELVWGCSNLSESLYVLNDAFGHLIAELSNAQH